MENININEDNSSHAFFPKKNQEIAVDVLKEAFPDIDEKIFNAVLIASNYSIESSFNALLSISDSNYKPEEPIQAQIEEDVMSNIMKFHQIENDYKYACYLSQMGENSLNEERNRYISHYGNKKEYSFNDELSNIYGNIKQGIGDAKTKVYSLFSKIKKRIDNDILFNEKKEKFIVSSPEEFTEMPRTSLNDSNITSYTFEDYVHLNLEDNGKASQGLLSNSCSENDLNQNLKKNNNKSYNLNDF
ncbi:hypothetical protein T552_02758 [Pneumocystis carinii B80]|uniref:CUE domain-containing protein n=1 Tax=Pneumocystis carinii (strain B80) TaxID=1408658 RepID=A0A0W4ZEH0_PNEC8|nr:hypothetical protein T552_02758 [Pneumocystis carinii B80]KTW26755.1 hypothetical protein T552_02758 [Pneumocystis carinii B80]